MMASVLWAVGTATWAGGVMGLRALAAARRSLRAMFFASAAYLAFGLIGALSGGVLWAVRGLAISAWFGAVLWWWQLHQAMRESATARVRGQRSAQHQQPAAKPLGRPTASGPAASDIVSPTVNETNGHLEHTGVPESTIKPELSGSVRASRERAATGQVGPNWSPQPQPSSPWIEALPASSPRAQSPGMASSEALFLSSRPPASSLPSPPPVSSARLPGPSDLIARQDRSALSSVPASPMPSFTPTSWTVMVAADRKYYDRMCKAGTPANPNVTFPIGDNERRFALSGTQMRIGRHGAAHDLEPEIDLAGPPTDPGVSRLHAVLITAPDGTWTVLDPGSANGTLLNGRKIAIGDMVPLHDGDRINLGAWTVITVHCR
jgi:FHA domain